MTYSHEISFVDLQQSFADVSARVGQDQRMLLNFSDCLLTVTASEFMQAIDDWFQHMGREARAALVFHPEAQKDQAMLVETKNFLMGGQTRSFTDHEQARAWLSPGNAPAG